MRVIAPEMFELDADESFTIRIECEGGAYLALGNVNNFNLPFTSAMPEARVTPAVLAGPDSVNRVHLHLGYPEDMPAEMYQIIVFDAGGNAVDTVSSHLNPDRPRPYRVDVDLVAHVL